MSISPTNIREFLDNPVKLDSRSLALRRTMVQVLEAGGRGHVGSAFSLVEIMRVLYDDVLRFDSKNPQWPQRDRCLLSKGQGCIALYVMLADKGFVPESELWKFCKSDGILGGHPDHKIPGVEASTGSLGHGFSIGVGFAINAKYEKQDHHTYVIIGDGESNEGSNWEAAMCASKHSLSNLTVLVDYNKYQSYGSTEEILDLEPIADKWRSFGFGTVEIDGHNVESLRTVLGKLPLEQNKPTAVICHTVKGKGVSYVENNMEWHHKNRVTAEEIASLMAELEDI